MFLSHDFRFSTYRNITKFCKIIHFVLFTLKKQTLELLLRLNQNLLQIAFKIFFLGLKFDPDVKKPLRGHEVILSYLGLKFPQFQPRKGNFFLYPYHKVIGLTNYECRISNYQLKVHTFFW